MATNIYNGHYPLSSDSLEMRKISFQKLWKKHLQFLNGIPNDANERDKYEDFARLIYLNTIDYIVTNVIGDQEDLIQRKVDEAYEDGYDDGFDDAKNNK